MAVSRVENPLDITWDMLLRPMTNMKRLENTGGVIIHLKLMKAMGFALLVKPIGIRNFRI